MSDKLSGITHPDDNHDRPWWGLPRPCPLYPAARADEGRSVM
ncbi:type IV toxin-antitoxin system YeeU family antitoxin, partial [Escherichia coli]